MRHVLLAMIRHPPINITFTDHGDPVCPVCGFVYEGMANGTWHPWAQRVEGGEWKPDHDYSICKDCGTEYGNEDMTAPGDDYNDTWRILRVRWLHTMGWAPESIRQVVENLGVSEVQLRDDAARQA